jgi:hypothetical protein
MLARIGAQMGFRVWVPPGDRARVLELVPAELHPVSLDTHLSDRRAAW